jgi:hypothetical protein
MKRPLAILGLLALTPFAAAQDAWKPVPGHIMTKWAADVAPDKAWPEYPRPQLVRDKWLNLNGLWDYAIAAPDQPKPKSGKILVPYPIESALSGVATPLHPQDTLTYSRSFELPKDWSGQRVLLHFGAVDWMAEVSINNKPVGEHTGGYDPFTFDITDALREGSNAITVEVTDPTDTIAHPIGKQRLKPESIWYTSTSGIWQTVWLEPVPLGFIRSVSWTTMCIGNEAPPGVPNGPNNGTACGKIDVELDSPAAGDELTFVVLDGDTEVSRSTSHCDTCGARRSLDVPIGRDAGRPLKLWSPESPFLYTLRATLSRRGQVIDQVTSYAALRDLKVAKDDAGLNRLMLNGKPLFQFGPLDQGFWPDGLYTPPTDEAMKQDILAVKKMGGNMLRKHVKVEPDRFYYWCDKLGLLVWQDMPSAFPPKDADEAWKLNFEDELQRIIAALRGHPSIVMWVPFNEGWGQHDTTWAATVVAKVKEWDPTRLVNNASGWTDMHVGDTTDLHDYPGPGMPRPEESRAAVLGEFGGLGLPLEGHTWVQKNNWGYVSFKNQQELTDAYINLIDRIPALIAQGLCAAVYTQTTDVEIECNGWMTYDRALWKIDPTRAAAATKKLYEPPPKITVLLADAHSPAQPPPAAGVATSWRYTLDKPEGKWTDPDFNDAAWHEGKAGFGSKGTPGAVIGTEWTTGDIWLRRKLEPFRDRNGVREEPTSPHLSIHHDEDAEVYINGVLVARFKGYTTGYSLEPISREAWNRVMMADDQMIIAVHCHQTTGGQYIDVGIVDVKPR